MKNRHNLTIRLLFYALLAVVGFGGALSLALGEWLFALSFLAMSLSGAIGLLAFDSDGGQDHE